MELFIKGVEADLSFRASGESIIIERIPHINRFAAYAVAIWVYACILCLISGAALGVRNSFVAGTLGNDWLSWALSLSVPTICFATIRKGMLDVWFPSTVFLDDQYRFKDILNTTAGYPIERRVHLWVRGGVGIEGMLLGGEIELVGGKKKYLFMEIRVGTLKQSRAVMSQAEHFFSQCHYQVTTYAESSR